MRFDATRSLRLSCLTGIALLAACSATGTDSTSSATDASGSWSTPATAQTTLSAQLAQSGSSLSGSGSLGVPPLAPASGPASPAYSGDNYTITSGTYNSPMVSFTATLGANPDGNGGFFRGTLSFTGTVSGSTMTGTVTFTPPRTLSQTFAAQTVTGVTLSRK